MKIYSFFVFSSFLQLTAVYASGHERSASPFDDLPDPFTHVGEITKSESKNETPSDEFEDFSLTAMGGGRHINTHPVTEHDNSDMELRIAVDLLERDGGFEDCAQATKLIENAMDQGSGAAFALYADRQEDLGVKIYCYMQAEEMGAKAFLGNFGKMFLQGVDSPIFPTESLIPIDLNRAFDIYQHVVGVYEFEEDLVHLYDLADQDLKDRLVAWAKQTHESLEQEDEDISYFLKHHQSIIAQEERSLQKLLNEEPTFNEAQYAAPVHSSTSQKKRRKNPKNPISRKTSDLPQLFSNATMDGEAFLNEIESMGPSSKDYNFLSANNDEESEALRNIAQQSLLQEQEQRHHELLQENQRLRIEFEDTKARYDAIILSHADFFYGAEAIKAEDMGNVEAIEAVMRELGML